MNKSTCVVVGSARGGVTVALLIALVMLQLVIVGVVAGGARDHGLTAQRVETMRALYAAEAGMNMAVREVFQQTDEDGDGGIGSISNNGIAVNDPAIGAARASATAVAGVGSTTILASGREGSCRRALEARVETGSSPAGSAATILLVVVNAASLDAQEQARKTLMEGWGYTVVPISESERRSTYRSLCRASSMAYICETVRASSVRRKLTSTTIPIVTEEAELSDELGIAGSMTAMTDRRVEIADNTHYITSAFSLGPLTLFNTDQPVRYLSGSYGGFTTLGHRVGSSGSATLVVMERGAALTTGRTAAGRRVHLPWGNTGMDINALTADGRALMRRSIEWCLMPVALWKLDNGSGSVATESILGRNGTLSGATWGSGRVDGALSFNGTTNYVSIANNADFQVTRSLTVAGWIKASNWPSDSNWASIVLRKGGVNPNNWQLHVCQGRVKLSLNDYDTYGYAGNTVLVTDQWHHVAATWDGSYVRIYADGLLDKPPMSRTSSIRRDTRELYIGGRIGSTDVVNGSVDDVRFYNRALTSGEIAALASPSARPRLASWQHAAP